MTGQGIVDNRILFFYKIRFIINMQWDKAKSFTPTVGGTKLCSQKTAPQSIDVKIEPRKSAPAIPSISPSDPNDHRKAQLSKRAMRWAKTERVVPCIGELRPVLPHSFKKEIRQAGKWLVFCFWLSFRPRPRAILAEGAIPQVNCAFPVRFLGRIMPANKAALK